MTDFNFYSETYCGSLISADAWDAVCRDAEAQMNRYERIYHVSYPQTGSRNMAVCAMAEALYEFAQLQDAGGAVQSVSVGCSFVSALPRTFSRAMAVPGSGSYPACTMALLARVVPMETSFSFSNTAARSLCCDSK